MDCAAHCYGQKYRPAVFTALVSFAHAWFDWHISLWGCGGTGRRIGWLGSHRLVLMKHIIYVMTLLSIRCLNIWNASLQHNHPYQLQWLGAYIFQRLVIYFHLFCKLKMWAVENSVWQTGMAESAMVKMTILAVTCPQEWMVMKNIMTQPAVRSNEDDSRENPPYLTSAWSEGSEDPQTKVKTWGISSYSSHSSPPLN